MTHRNARVLEALGTALGLAIGAGPSLPAQAASEFSDVPEEHAQHDDIAWLAKAGISTGWPDGTFRPSQSVGRDAMAAFLYRLAAPANYRAPRTPRFADVPVTHPFYTEISWLADQGISTGWPDGTFRPSLPIARDAMAAFLCRFSCAPLAHTAGQDPFADVAADHQFAKEIAWMRSSGLSLGWDDGTYRPAANTERGAMAAFLYRYSQKGFASPDECSSAMRTDAEASPELRGGMGQVRSGVLEAARKLIGTPYLYGGENPAIGLDCSGLVRYVYARFGYDVPHSSSAIRSAYRQIPGEQALPGDIMWWPGHVAIYTGNGQIEAVYEGVPARERVGSVRSGAVYLRILD